MANDSRVRELITLYKRSYAKLIRQNKSSEIVSLFCEPEEAQSNEFGKKVVQCAGKATSSEELFINQINFIFSLLNNVEKEIILSDYIYDSFDPIWWNKKYSRSTYYRNRTKAINTFLKYYETIDQI